MRVKLCECSLYCELSTLCCFSPVDVGTLKDVEPLKFLCVLDLFELCSLIYELFR